MASSGFSYTASNIATFIDCEQRFYWEIRRENLGLLPTDRIAADVGQALHGALMRFHHNAELRQASGRVPNRELARIHFADLIEGQLMKHGLNRAHPAVAGRLERLLPGAARVTEQILDDLSGWVRGTDGHTALVWSEQTLDHGPGARAVEMEPGIVVRTRADVIGLRPGPGGARAVVRDFKSKAEPVDPIADAGCVVRAIWVLQELRQPRCKWFLAGRPVEVDVTGVDLEVVNLAYADSDDFLVRASASAERILSERDRLVDVLRRMGGVAAAPAALDLYPTPGGLCHRFCPYLGRCAAGREHVAKYVSDDALDARLAERLDPRDELS